MRYIVVASSSSAIDRERRADRRVRTLGPSAAGEKETEGEGPAEEEEEKVKGLFYWEGGREGGAAAANGRNLSMREKKGKAAGEMRGRGTDRQAGGAFNRNREVTYYFHFPSFSDEPLAEGIWDPIKAIIGS